MLLKNKLFRLFFLLFVIYATNEKLNVGNAHSDERQAVLSESPPYKQSHVKYFFEGSDAAESSVKETEDEAPAWFRVKNKKRFSSIEVERFFQVYSKALFKSYCALKDSQTSLISLFIKFRQLLI